MTDAPIPGVLPDAGVAEAVRAVRRVSLTEGRDDTCMVCGCVGLYRPHANEIAVEAALRHVRGAGE